MNTKEAIEWLDNFVDYGYDWNGYREKELQEIKNLLKQGEKYKEMWEELKEFYGERKAIPQTQMYLSAEEKYISAIMEELEEE